MFHTSPNKIEKINNDGIAGDCLFFSDNIYKMTAASTYFVYEADFNCVDASQLYDDEIIEEIAAFFDVDTDTAERLLDVREVVWNVGGDTESAWWLQGKRGRCAVKMGYDGCEDEDEQGTVYIVPMSDRESELKLIQTN